MIHTHAQLPRVVAARYPTFLSRINESIVVPWRTAAFVFHIAGLLAVADYRFTLAVNGSLLPGYTQADLDATVALAEGAIGASFVCLLIVFFALLTGRTLRSESNNAIQAICHTAAGALLLAIWSYDSHVARIWHVWAFFGAPPALLEVGVALYSVRRGLTAW